MKKLWDDQSIGQDEVLGIIMENGARFARSLLTPDDLNDSCCSTLSHKLHQKTNVPLVNEDPLLMVALTAPAHGSAPFHTDYNLFRKHISA